MHWCSVRRAASTGEGGDLCHNKIHVYKKVKIEDIIAHSVRNRGGKNSLENLGKPQYKKKHKSSDNVTRREGGYPLSLAFGGMWGGV